MELKKQGVISSPLACSVRIIFKNIVVGFVITFILFLIFAFVLTYTDLPYKYISPASVAITLAGIFLASLLNGRKTAERGWLTGCVTGLLYMVIIYLAGAVAFGSLAITPAGIGMIGAGMLFAVAGSIIGINNKPNRR